MVNINQELFKKYAPKTKWEIVSKLTTDELFLITSATILRILKEAGSADYPQKKRNKFKTLHFSVVSNHWNSDVSSIYNGKKDALYANVYIQGDDTDSEDSCPIEKVIHSGYTDICLATMTETFRNGHSHTVYAEYDRAQRAEIIKAILQQYIINKYHYEPQSDRAKSK